MVIIISKQISKRNQADAIAQGYLFSLFSNTNIIVQPIEPTIPLFPQMCERENRQGYGTFSYSLFIDLVQGTD
jgi:hypothetical protein